ncbi:uncharacterized protein LOC144884900 isoform X2 [Branchiostoma floridae x Branchiostoma japonicum]
MEEGNVNAITEDMIKNGGNQSLFAWLKQHAHYILVVGPVMFMVVFSRTVLFWLARQIRNTSWQLLAKLLSVTPTFVKVWVGKTYRIATEILSVVVRQIWSEGIRGIASRPFLTEIRAVLSTQLKPRGPVAPGEVKDELCVVAADQHTLSTIAEEVREATADSFYPVREHRVSNRRDVADLPLYRRAICCVRNAERNISFNKHGEPEPDADLGFRAFHKMEASVGQSGVLLLLFDHAESQGISDLYSMEGLTPSQRLLDTAKDSPCRFLTVYRNLTIKQKEFIKTWVKP